jgi:hypothetical protein
MGHVIMENRGGLVVATAMTHATGTAEREAAAHGAVARHDDDESAFRRAGMTPHVTQNAKGRRSAIDGRTTRHLGYALSLRARKRIEEVFDWIKMVGGLRKTRHCGTALVGWMFTLTVAAYNLVRLPKLLAAAA